MLTEREEKIVRRIVSGERKKVLIIVFVFLMIFYPISSYFQLSPRIKLLNELEKAAEKDNVAVRNLETKTSLEQRLKDELLFNYKIQKEISRKVKAEYIAIHIGIYVGFLLVFLIFSILIFKLDRIIEKLREQHPK